MSSVPSLFRHFRRALAYALLLAAALGDAACTRTAGGPPPRPPAPVQTAPAIRLNTPLVLTGFGTTSERAGVDIVPQVSGALLKRYFADGAIVTNGQPLFLIDPADYALRVQQAESLLAADRANCELTRLTVDRNRPLLAKKLISPEDFDTLQARLDTALAQVRNDEAALGQARLNLARCTICAPMDGICSKHLMDEGNLAAAGVSRLTNIRSYDPINVDFSLSEQYLAAIRRALQTPPVRIEVAPRGDTNRYAGTLVFMDNAVSSQTGTIALRGIVPNPDLKLWASQFVEVRLFASMEPNAIMVPEGAVQFGKMGSYLYTVQAVEQTQTSTNTPSWWRKLLGAKPTATATSLLSDVVSLRPVQTGLRYEDRIQIRSGVAAGERVVVLGQLRIYPGASVTDLSQPKKAAAAPSK